MAARSSKGDGDPGGPRPSRPVPSQPARPPSTLRPVGLRRPEKPEELTCLPPPPPLLCGGAAEVLAKVAAPKPPPLLLPPVPLAAPEPVTPPPAPPRPVQWWQRISPWAPFFHMEDDVVLQMLQVGLRPRGIVAGSGGPRGRSDTGMATTGLGRPLVGLPRPAPSCPRRDQPPAAAPWRQEADRTNSEPDTTSGLPEAPGNGAGAGPGLGGEPGQDQRGFRGGRGRRRAGGPT